MSVRGRRPEPSALRLVKGNAGHRPPPPITEADVPLAQPSPPDHLSDDGKVEWGRVVSRLFECGLMTDLDRAVLGGYCDAYAVWVGASRLLAEQAAASPKTRGLTVTTTNGNVIQNPVLGTIRTARADMLRFAVEFGMTPSARSRIDVGIGSSAAPAAGGEKGAGSEADRKASGHSFF